MKTHMSLMVAAVMLMPLSSVAENILTCEGASGRTVTVTAVSPYIIRVDNYAAGDKFLPGTTQSVLPLEGQSADARVVRRADGTASMTTTAGIKVDYDGAGGLSIGGGRRGSTVFDSGLRSFGGHANGIRLATSSEGSFYGAGERGHSFNLRGDTLVMYNRQNYGYTGDDPRINQMNITMPLFLSSDGFAVVFDDFAAAKMVMNNPIEYITESDRPVTWYYVGGVSSLDDVTEHLTELTGRQPLAPFWALGYITSKYGYRTQAETEGTIDTLRRAGYPVDGIVLDLYWYGKEQDMGSLSWEPSQWPDHEGMLARLDSLGVKTIAISQPYVLRNGRGISVYDELAPKGMFVADSAGGVQDVTIWVGEGGMFDVSNPATRQWLSDRYEALTRGGMGGWWGDLGEPEVHPESGVHANGLSTRLYHNKYGNDWSSIIADLYKSKFSDRRLMTLMRGGTTGLQRYSVFPWSTDVSRSWGGLEPQIRIMLNSGLSGLGYMSSDLGGFAVDPEHPYLPELYVRWLQAGLFTPVFRTHAQQFAEPYNYPQYASIVEPLVKERYRWLPYNYTLAYENAAFGLPLVRPLDFRCSASGRYDNVTDQYLWGDELLVAPVLVEGAVQRKIVFPEGSEWIDMYDPSARYAGGTEIEAYDAPLDKLPLFVRAGAFIPTADYAMSNTGDYRAGEFTINYFPSAGVESNYSLFDDNKVSPDTPLTGQYRLINFAGSDNGRRTDIRICSEGTYEGAPVQVVLHMAVRLDRDAKVKVDGRRTASHYDAASGILSFDVTFTAGKECNIEINR